MSFFSIFIVSISSLLNIDYSNRQTLYAASISYINLFEKNAIITNESKFFESMAEILDTSSLYNKVGGYLMGFFLIFVIVVFLMMGNQWIKKK